MATKIDQIKIGTNAYDIDLPPDAAPSIASLTVAGSIMIGTTGKVTLNRPTGTTNYTITLPSSTGTLALQSETPGASVAPGAALISNTAKTLEWRNALTYVSGIPSPVPFSPAFGIYSNGTKYTNDTAMTCYWSAAESVPTSLPATDFPAYHSVTMLNPVTYLFSVGSSRTLPSDGYVFIPLETIFHAAGISTSPTDGWRIMNYHVTPRKQTNAGYAPGYWASLWRPGTGENKGLVAMNYGSWSYSDFTDTCLVVAADENSLSYGFEASIIVSKPLN